jgi:hypothetical protein
LVDGGQPLTDKNFISRLKAIAMVVYFYFALFAILVAALGWLVAIVYERRQDVLYGRYLPPDIRKNARIRSQHVD